MAQLSENGSFWIIIINPNLPSTRRTEWKKGIIRQWGRDGRKEKLKYVYYPKSEFNRADMVRIVPKYNSCRLCEVGQIGFKKSENTLSMFLIGSFIILPISFMFIKELPKYIN
jgi:hypothetical protein